MAKMKNKKNNLATSRTAQTSRGRDTANEAFDTGEDFSQGADSMVEEAEEANYQAAGSRQNSDSRGDSAPRKQMSNGRPSEFDPGQLLDSARDFIEGHPGRATLIGALIGGAAAGLFATERGRSLVRAAYSYARPMIADYARDFVSSQSGSAIENALPQ